MFGRGVAVWTHPADVWTRQAERPRRVNKRPWKTRGLRHEWARANT